MADEAPSLSGIWAATLTPIDARFNPDAPRAIEYYAQLLNDGCDGLNVLGTTGEAMSFDCTFTARSRLWSASAKTSRIGGSWPARARRRSPALFGLSRAALELEAIRN